MNADDRPVDSGRRAFFARTAAAALASGAASSPESLKIFRHPV